VGLLLQFRKQRVLLTGSRKLRIFCVKLHVIVIVLVTVIATARMKPLLLLLFLPKIKTRVKQKTKTNNTCKNLRKKAKKI
jgi:hypothetical protein